DAQLAPALARALDRRPTAALRDALLACDAYGRPGELGGSWNFRSEPDAVAMLRLIACSGAERRELQRWEAHCGWGLSWEQACHGALLSDLDEALYRRLHPSVQALLLEAELDERAGTWASHSTLPAPELAEQLLARAAADPSIAEAVAGSELRWCWAYFLLLAGRADEIEPVLAPLTEVGPGVSEALAAHWDSLADAMEGARLAGLGEWPEAIARYEQALAARRSATGQRKGLLPLLLATPYVLAQMAQGEPAGLRAALKYCLTESGKRQANPDSPWGLMALALEMRLGETRRDLQRFTAATRAPYLDPLDYWRWLMRAWLAEGSTEPATGAGRKVPAPWQTLHQRFVAAGLSGLARQLDDALAVIQGRAASPNFFAAKRAESWRNTLAALAAVAAPSSANAEPAKASVQASRIVWVLDVNAFGALRELTPWEQKEGSRGWGKPKALPLSRLARSEGLAPHDQALARCVRQHSADRTWRLDLAAAAVALLGHPHLEFADTPGVPVALVDATPELELTEQGDTLRLRLNPPPRWADPAAMAAEPQPGWYAQTAADQREREALSDLTIQRDTPQRARLLRLNPAQKRAAQLIGAGLTLPKAAAQELEPVLRSLGGHFQIQADALQARREVPAEPRLRAELSPQGEGV
ncbi:MAG TPA: hypothetical protein PLW24_24475, partial [Burkholderiaceae bacterium]|nr:hypothetical protein [Burkholderiaceae bacterium]